MHDRLLWRRYYGGLGPGASKNPENSLRTGLGLRQDLARSARPARRPPEGEEAGVPLPGQRPPEAIQPRRGSVFVAPRRKS